MVAYVSVLSIASLQDKFEDTFNRNFNRNETLLNISVADNCETGDKIHTITSLSLVLL